jgi:hypothetical protein
MQPSGDHTQPHTDKSSDPTYRLTVHQAADTLGITAEAIRQRIKRGTLQAERTKDGSVFVLLDADQYRTGARPHDNHTQPNANPTIDPTELIEALRDQVSTLKSEVEAWRDEARRKDHLLAAALERIPAIEAPQEPSPEPRDSAETPFEKAAKGDPPPGDTEQPRAERSWWQRWFGG